MGSESWRKSPVEENNLYQTIRGLDPYKSYEIRMVAMDGDYKTPSDTVRVGPWKGKSDFFLLSISV